MEIIIGFPPNIDAIDAVFQTKQKKGIIYTWGNKIYNPSGGELTSMLKAHENVHYTRQTNDVSKIEAWWDQYLVDVEFRLREELPAHRAEYVNFCQSHKDRNQRNLYLQAVAGRLSGPLYLNLISLSKAKQELLR